MIIEQKEHFLESCCAFSCSCFFPR